MLTEALEALNVKVFVAKSNGLSPASLVARLT